MVAPLSLGVCRPCRSAIAWLRWAAGDTPPLGGLPASLRSTGTFGAAGRASAFGRSLCSYALFPPVLPPLPSGRSVLAPIGARPLPPFWLYCSRIARPRAPWVSQACRWRSAIVAPDPRPMSVAWFPPCGARRSEVCGLRPPAQPAALTPSALKGTGAE